MEPYVLPARLRLGVPALLLPFLAACGGGGGGTAFAPGPQLSQVAAGPYHMLAARADGTVWAWGSNAFGELGDGTTTDHPAPVQVPGLTGVVGVSAAGGDLVRVGGPATPATGISLALKSDGTLWAWGFNQLAELGDGSMADRHGPVAVAGLANVVTMSAGPQHGLAVTGNGTAWAWGDNSSGELGDGTQVNRAQPVKVAGLSGVVGVKALGGSFADAMLSMALKNDGTVWLWGAVDGLLPGSSASQVSSPVQVAGLSGVTAIEGFQGQALALKGNGTLWAWGGNLQGGTLAQPTPITGLGKVARMAGNAAVLTDGTTWTWSWNPDGTQAVPVQVAGLSGGLQIASGGSTTVVLDGGGHAWSWGDNTYGQLGTGAPLAQPTPRPTNLGPAVQVSARGADNLAVLTDGGLWAWGGQVYSTTGAPGSVPVRIGSTPGLAAAANGSDHLLALVAGNVLAQGSNVFGELGNGSTTDSPATLVPVSGLPAVKAVAAAEWFSLALGLDGSVWSWGYGGEGTLGTGANPLAQTTPVRVPGLPPVQALAAAGGMTGSIEGLEHTLALAADGTVWGWGQNLQGQLGDGTTTLRWTPVQTAGLTGVTALAAGPFHSLAVLQDGTVWAWGDNASGELGNGTTSRQVVPAPVPGLANIVAVACGGWSDGYGATRVHSLALDATGHVWAWGSNRYGQLGDGTFQDRLSPVQVPGLSGVTAVAAGSCHSVAVTASGVWTWGADYYGQLGLGRTLGTSSPVKAY